MTNQIEEYTKSGLCLSLVHEVTYTWIHVLVSLSQLINTSASFHIKPIFSLPHILRFSLISNFQVVQCTGHIKLSKSEATPFGQLRPPVPCMVLVASPIPHPVNIETPLDTKTFMTRHSMDMKFTDCDER